MSNRQEGVVGVIIIVLIVLGLAVYLNGRAFNRPLLNPVEPPDDIDRATWEKIRKADEDHIKKLLEERRGRPESAIERWFWR